MDILGPLLFFIVMLSLTQVVIGVKYLKDLKDFQQRSNEHSRSECTQNIITRKSLEVIEKRLQISCEVIEKLKAAVEKGNGKT